MRVIGLMSGTSVDGIDAALIEITPDWRVTTLATQTTPYPLALRAKLLALGEGQLISMLEVGQLHRDLGELYGRCVLDLIQEAGPADLIGCHGQTVAHQPPQEKQRGFSLQLGDGAVIAAVTGIPVVSNFRARDLAEGGHGAPLVPYVDWLLGHDAQQNRCLQNIGGIANVSYLPAGGDQTTVIAFDTGAGNMLLDLTVAQFSDGQARYDSNGAKARQGTVNLLLLQQLLAHPYMQQTPPKSTGRETFGAAYFQSWLARFPELSEADWLATFTEFTAQSIGRAYQQFLPRLPEVVYVSGGAVHNRYLMERLQSALPEVAVTTSQDLGIDPTYKEAICFAVLANLRWRGLTGNLPQVTQARQPLLLGDLHPGKSEL